MIASGLYRYVGETTTQLLHGRVYEIIQTELNQHTISVYELLDDTCYTLNAPGKLTFNRDWKRIPS
jgi:hypothetical protein